MSPAQSNILACKQTVCAHAVALLLSVSLSSSALAEALSDPTQPPLTRAAIVKPQFALRLEAIIGADQRRLAIVDGKIVHVGDRIEEALITHISADAVHYTHAGRERIARLTQNRLSVRQPSIPDRDTP